MWSLIQVLRNARLLPTAGQTAGRKQSYWRRAAHLSSPSPYLSLSTVIKTCFHQKQSQINKADHAEIWLLNSTHAPGKRLRPCMLRARFFFPFVFKGKRQTKIASTLAESHTVMLSTRKLNGRLNETLQSIRQPNYGEEMLQNDNVWIFHGFFLSCLARETVVKFNESVLTGFLSSIIIFYNIFMGFLWLRSIF